MELKKEEKRQRQLVRDNFYPLLLAHGKSVEDVKIHLEAILQGLKSLFQKKVFESQKEWSRKSLSELGLRDLLDENHDVALDIAVIELFKEESVAVSENLINGMLHEINDMERKEMIERPLSSLKTDWLD